MTDLTEWVTYLESTYRQWNQYQESISSVDSDSDSDI